jgi:hypothetical protein
MRIDSSGNVLIGGTSSAAKFAVANNTFDETFLVKPYGVFGTTTEFLDSDSPNVVGTGVGELQIHNGTGARPAVLSLGGSLAPAETLGMINFFRSGNTDNYRSRALISGFVSSSGTANQHGGVLRFSTAADGATNPSERMSITSDGALILVGSTAQKASGTSWSNPSDTRLKDNKQNYTKGLNELLQINVKTWEWNGKAGTTQGDAGIGVIADEIETILPNTIDTYKVKLNEDDIEETDVKRFDATEITWLLLNSVKEQQEIIEELKSRITAMENK